MPNLAAIIQSLPPGLCGIVFRHDASPGRAALGAQIAKICRARRIALVVAGDSRLAAALRAGLHLRGGRRPGFAPLPPRGIVTSSAHNHAELRRARRSGAQIIFCSPVFATASHPGAPTLGPFGFRRIAHHAPPAKAYALGGIDGASIRILGKTCAGAGAIDAFLRKVDHRT